jgi:hypothetical protein
LARFCKTQEIDTFAKLPFDFAQKGTFVASGRAFGEDFPNLEVFLASPGSKSALLIDGHTTGSQETGPMTNLRGSHEDQLLRQLNFSLPVDDDGNLLSSFRAQATTMRIVSSASDAMPTAILDIPVAQDPAPYREHAQQVPHPVPRARRPVIASNIEDLISHNLCPSSFAHRRCATLRHSRLNIPAPPRATRPDFRT